MKEIAVQTRELDCGPDVAGKTLFRAFGPIALAAGVMLAAGMAAAADGARRQSAVCTLEH